MYDFDTPYYSAPRSPKWEGLVEEILKEFKTCACCGTENHLEVHHIKPFHLFPALELEKTNLIVLCRPHHFDRGHYCNWESWNPHVARDCRSWLARIKSRP